MEGPALNGAQALAGQRLATVDQSRFVGPVVSRHSRNAGGILFIRLRQVRGVGVDDQALFLHPGDGRPGVKAARESDADARSSGRKGGVDSSHCVAFPPAKAL